MKPEDFSALRPLAAAIEQARIESSKDPMLMGGYLLGVAVAYMRTGGGSDELIRKTLEAALVDD